MKKTNLMNPSSTFKRHKKFSIVPYLSALVLSLIPLISPATEDFHAWRLKPGHEGIRCDKLSFPEKSFTLELWLNLDEGSDAEMTNIAATMSDGKTGFILDLRKNQANGNAIELRFMAKTPDNVSIPFFLPLDAFLGKWGHMAFVISEAENKAYAYLNGDLYSSLDASGGWMGNNTATALQIAGWYNDPKPTGQLADFRIWSIARTAEQIKENFDKHLAGDKTGLVVEYTFQSKEQTIANSAGSNNPGVCRPESGWQDFHDTEILSPAPLYVGIASGRVSWDEYSILNPDALHSGNFIIRIEPETEKLLRNPLNGWVLYGSASAASDFWSKYDKLKISDDFTVSISDYAHTLYIRTSWTILNPEEDVYGWNTDEKLKWMIDNARQRNMKLAFRVVVDSRDKSSDYTPKYVRDAGAQGYETKTGSKTVWSPYPDDPVFQAKYEKFMQAFGQQFNDPDVVEFIDGYGLGKWGEGHSMLYLDIANREAVFDWICDLYLEQFTAVPVAVNYHRLIGTPKDWGSPDPQSQAMLESAFNKGFILRHDAFGMSGYYQQWEKNLAAKWNGIRPVIMEGGWVTQQHPYWDDPRKYETVADVRQGEFDDSMEARVNMMDFRVNEAESWFRDAYPLVQRFIAEGGYRLYPDSLSLPNSVSAAAPATIIHRWKNLGWGYCPTNIPQWNQKYKVAFGLLDEKDRPVASFTDTQTDLSTWLKDAPVTYRFTPSLAGVSPGNYTWAVAIIDTTKNNTKGIDISAKKNITASGWLKLMNVTVK
ncbi:MAG: LamG domain-containing protein [Dysgonamonadaceae bacterium]|jgi:hypothetical protein|nr:LamG domain-containing protein [Dysgonamonadaceae bacterium]